MALPTVEGQLTDPAILPDLTYDAMRYIDALAAVKDSHAGVLVNHLMIGLPLELVAANHGSTLPRRQHVADLSDPLPVLQLSLWIDHADSLLHLVPSFLEQLQSVLREAAGDREQVRLCALWLLG